MKLLVCLCLIVVCVAQVPTPCTSPKQWTGRRVRFDRFRQYTEFGRHYYDEVNMRTRTIEERDVGKERDYYDTLHLHNVGMEYRLNIRTKQCNVTRLTSPFRYIGVPPTSKFLFEAVIGAADVPSEHLTAATFSGNFQDGAAYIVTVGYPDCVPISFDVRSNTTTEHFGERYYDLHLGVSDPAAFIPPTECAKSFEE